MSSTDRWIAGGALAALALACAAPSPVRAETLTCTEITALPAVIATQGQYCLKKDLGTALATGYAIDIQANNVTLDCNGFKIGGLDAGLGTTTIGVHALARQNTIVRGCSIRGFYMGVSLEDPTESFPLGVVVEDNRLDFNIRRGIYVAGDASIVRRNLVSGTGHDGVSHTVIGILVNGGVDVVDNTIDGVAAGTFLATGIYSANLTSHVGTVIAGNRIRNLASSNHSLGVHVYGLEHVVIRDNSLAKPGTLDPSTAFFCEVGGYLHGNAVIGFADFSEGCEVGAYNPYLPFPAIIEPPPG
jgi:hypothetical protein